MSTNREAVFHKIKHFGAVASLMICGFAEFVDLFLNIAELIAMVGA